MTLVLLTQLRYWIWFCLEDFFWRSDMNKNNSFKPYLWKLLVVFQQKFRVLFNNDNFFETRQLDRSFLTNGYKINPMQMRSPWEAKPNLKMQEAYWTFNIFWEGGSSFNTGKTGSVCQMAAKLQAFKLLEWFESGQTRIWADALSHTSTGLAEAADCFFRNPTLTATGCSN